MAKREVVIAVRKYLEILRQEGIDIEKAILFGSHAKGIARDDSDIDLMLVSPMFDQRNIWLLGKAWSLTKQADVRIEPFMVGSRQFLEDTMSPLLDIVRKEGIEIRAAA